ncbi:MAG: hypothetical protein IT338_06910 [Thermomicrobiales bacterium]|nr:hypothetical protein [Thermomicrobiales bacterium]
MIGRRTGTARRARVEIGGLSGRARFAIAGASLAMTLVAAPAVTALMQLPDEPSPESGTAQVVAQGVVGIGKGDLRWEVTEQTAPPPGNANPVTSGLGFITVDSGVMLVEDLGTGAQQRLAAGEAALTLPGAEQARVALGSDVAGYHQLLLVSGASETAPANASFISDPFTGTGDRHDVDLLQDALAPGATMAIPAGALPALVVVLDGSASVTTESGDVVSLGTGEAIALTGSLVVTAAENGADVAAVYTGPAVPRLAQAAATPATVAQTATPTSGRAVTGAASPATVAVAAAATPRAQAASASPDDDGDGLDARQEERYGTDPSLSDTDEDGLSDGQEVVEFKTDPLKPDTDGDGTLDGDEIAQGTNPLDPANGAVAAQPTDETASETPAPVEEETAPQATTATPGDSDGDGLEDAIELELGTDPYDIDTDDDGLTDGDEYYVYQTGTRNPDTDGDGVLDGDEIANGTDPNDPASA